MFGTKFLKKNTAILQVPEQVIDDKNKLINSTTNLYKLKPDVIKIQIGNTLKLLSKGTSIEPELYYSRFQQQPFIIVIKPLKETEFKKFNTKEFGYVDSVKKFNSLNFNDKFKIEQNIKINSDIIKINRKKQYQDIGQDMEYYMRYLYNPFQDKKATKSATMASIRKEIIDGEIYKFNWTIADNRKNKSKTQFLNYLAFDAAEGDFTKYRFIF